MQKTKIAYLWQDRKRVFGLPLSFTRYRLSEDRLFTSKGFLNVKDDEVLLYRIRDISTSRSLFQRLLGQQIGSFFCIPCLAERLGVEEARLRSFMQRLKDAGCSYFKRIAEE